MRRITRQLRTAQRPEPDAMRRQHSGLNGMMQNMAVRAMRRFISWTGPALLLAAGLLALSGARPLTANVNARVAAPAVARAALGPSQPKSGGGTDLRRWVDPHNGSAYIVVFRQNPQGPTGAFSFTLPNGDQIIGGTGNSLDPIQPSPASDGSLIQATACGDGVPDFGYLIPAGQDASAVYSIKGGPTSNEVYYVLRAHLDASGLMAYATLDFVSASSYRGNLCSESAPYPYVVQAGCDLAQCRDPVQSATQDVQHYDDAVVQAAQNGGAGAWQAVWPLTASLIRGQYSQAEFGAAMAKQEQSVGRITQITETSAPDVQLDVAMQPFFSVTQDVTVSKDGNSKVVPTTSYFLLEDQQWAFWFSAS